jgi:hypothetical protein
MSTFLGGGTPILVMVLWDFCNFVPFLRNKTSVVFEIINPMFSISSTHTLGKQQPGLGKMWKKKSFVKCK